MAAKRVHVMTPARKAALRKAQIASVRAKKRASYMRNKGRAPKRINRGEGISGLTRNFIPYARVNKRSQTGGFNVGTIIPGSGKRIVVGGYTRLENTHKHGMIDVALGNIGAVVAPRGSGRRKVMDYFKRNVSVANPALRGRIGNAELRLGTSRGAGPTLIVRRGRHKVSHQGSYKAIKRFDTQARKLNARRVSKPRPQRRRANG